MIYLDACATTKPYEEVLRSFMTVNEQYYANPNSPHKFASTVQTLIEASDEQFTSHFQTEHAYIYTSGATESNNIALLGVARRKKQFGQTIVASPIEHPSILNPLKQLEKEGFNILWMNVDQYGCVDIDSFSNLMSTDVILVTCMAINNIVGSIQPIKALGDLLQQYPKAHFHVDMTQAVGKMDLNMFELSKVDSFSFSAHKFHGIKGIGGLAIMNDNQLQPIQYGGQQQTPIKSGTINVPAIVSMAKALNESSKLKINRYNEFIQQKDGIHRFIQKNMPKIKLNSDIEHTVPHVINLSFKGVTGEVIVNALNEYDIYVSTTSACHSKHQSLNETLSHMNMSVEEIKGSIRISFDDILSNETLDELLKALREIYKSVEEVMN